MSKKQTAVEWLVSQQREIQLRLEANIITSHEANSLERNAVIQAIEMEREHRERDILSAVELARQGVFFKINDSETDKEWDFTETEIINKLIGKEDNQ